MERLCERPGCSDPASVAYGMRAEDLVFWLDRYPESVGGDVGVLCRRHADSMVVPRGWTLDDLRDPDLHLFRPPAPVPFTRARRARLPRPTIVGEQLELDDTAELVMPFVEPPKASIVDDSRRGVGAVDAGVRRGGRPGRIVECTEPAVVACVPDCRPSRRMIEPR